MSRDRSGLLSELASLEREMSDTVQAQRAQFSDVVMRADLHQLRQQIEAHSDRVRALREQLQVEARARARACDNRERVI